MGLTYLEPSDQFWAIDIEGDGLPSTRVWCLVAINVMTQETYRLTTYEDIKAFIESKRKAGCKFIGHNIIGYDAPTLNRLCGTSLTISDLIDTMLMSMLYSPSIQDGHSLGAWGTRLRFPKTDFSDFSRFTPQMLNYCWNDTELCRRVYFALVGRMTKAKFTNDGIEIEHRSWQLIEIQKKNGFHFNIQEAHVLLNRIRTAEDDLKQEIYKYWPPELKIVKEYKQAFKKDGSKTKALLEHEVQFPRIDVLNDGGYKAWDYVEFNIGSPQQRVQKLLEAGWKCLPDELTDAGNPSPTKKGKLVPSLVKFVEDSGKEEIKLIAQWIEVNARGNMVNTWIEAYNENTRAIHGDLWLANTLRYKHSKPNSANIPGVRTDKEGHAVLGREGAFTYEARDLWGTRDPDNRRMVGVDAKGIQLRVLAHHLNNKQFMEAVLDGDPHSYNQEIGGFASRSVAKTFIYAFLLGCGDAKAGQIIGGSTKDGREVKGRFINNFPGLKGLLDDLEGQINRTGRIILCDGTPLIVTSPHTRLGYLLQGDENRIMKKAAILVHNEVRRRKLDVLKVGDIHDEWQNDVLNEHVDEFANDVCPKGFRASGEFFNYRVPIDCDAKVGLTWAQTH